MPARSAPVYRRATRADQRALWDLWADSYVIEDPAVIRRWRSVADPNEARVVTVGGRPVACGELLALEMYVGGRACATGGLAAVASSFLDRRQGHIGVLIDGMLREMRAAKQAWSLLMPFSAPFYARYGWANAEERRIATVPLAALARREKPAGRIRKATLRDLAACTRLYEQWGHKYNLMLRRSPGWWKTRVLALMTPRRGAERRWFVAMDERGTIDGYCVVHFENPLTPVAQMDTALHRQLHVRDMAWTTPRGRAALLAFLGDMDSQARDLVWRIAPDDPLLATLPLHNPATITHRTAKMARIVDVKRALTGAPAVDTPGLRAVIEVEDTHAPWNSGRWALDTAEGVLRVSPTTAKADAACDIAVLSQIALGAVKAKTAADAGLATGPSLDALTLVESVGGGRPNYLMDAF